MNRSVRTAIVAGLAVVGLVVWGVIAMRSETSEPRPEDILQTYRNEEHGFELTYLKGLTPEASFRRYYALSDKWRAEAPEEQNGTALVAIPIFRVDNPDGTATGKPYPLYFSAEVRVGVSSDPEALEDCLKPDPGYTDQKQETVVLNGTQFERFEFGSAAAMQYVQGVSYRAVRDEKCFAIEQLKAGSTYRDESMQAGIPDEQLDVYYSQAGDIARTFRFTN